MCPKWQAQVRCYHQLQVPENLASKLLNCARLRPCSLTDLSSALQVSPLGVTVDLAHAEWGFGLTLTSDLCVVRVDAD